MSAKQRGGAFVWVIVIVVLIAAGGVWLWKGRSTAGGGDVAVTWKTRQEKLRISVIESGQLKASKSNDIYNEVKGGATILYLVPEGTQVNAGDLLVRLDASTLENDLTAQRIKWEQANAAWIQADKTKEIQVSLNLSAEDKAKVDLAIATADVDKYKEGDWKIKQEQAEQDIKLAQSELAIAEQKLHDTEELVALEFAAKMDLDGDTFARDQKSVKLTMTKRQLEVMLKYEYDRQMMQLTSTMNQNRAELERVKLRAVADMAQKEADLHSKQATLDLERNKLEDLEEQLAKTVIKAPTSGLVVYPGNQGGMGGMGRSDRDRVEEGATVREHQLLISLPDTSEMTVVVSVHESAIDKIRLGQPVEVGIDAIGDKSFLGKVTFIAPLPDSQNQWLNPDLKIYRCEVTLGGDTTMLRPGMSASTEIVIDEIQDAIAVPLHAVRRRGDHYYCYVEGADGKPEIQEVKIGLHNDQHVAVTEGLREGQSIFLSEPPGAPQPKFADAAEASKTSVEELRKKTSDINARPKSDESKRGEGREGRPGRGQTPAMTAEQREKWNKMTPEERKKASEEFMKNMTPEQRAQMEEARKRFGGGDGKADGKSDGKADGKGGPKPDAPADAKAGEKPAGKPAEPAVAPAQGGGR